MSAPAAFFKPATKHEFAGLSRSLGLLVDRLIRQRVRPNPTLAKPVSVREETRFYTMADLLRRWLRRGERRTSEGEAAGLILEMPARVATVLATVQATHERIDRMELRQNAVLASLLELKAVSEPEAEPEPEPEPEAA